jgi:hypothetical protein
MPLSEYPNGEQKLGSALAFGTATGGTPPDKVKATDLLAFFTAFATALKANPPHVADGEMVRELACIGIIPGQDFDASRLTAEQRRAISEGAHAAAERVERSITAAASTKPGWAGYRSTIGRYGTNYTARVAIARFAIGANPPEDAIYLNCGCGSTSNTPKSAARRYSHPPLRFSTGRILMNASTAWILPS